MSKSEFIIWLYEEKDRLDENLLVDDFSISGIGSIDEVNWKEVE